MGMLEWVIEGLLDTYWAILVIFSDLANAYTNVSGASWLTTLQGNLEGLCTNTLMPAFAGVGMAVSVTYFLISIIGLVTEDRLTPEFLAKFFAKLAISVAVIMWSDTILVAIIDFGDAMGNMFTGWVVNDFVGNNGSDMNSTFSNFARTLMNTVQNDTDFKINGSASVTSGWVSQNFKWYENGSDYGIIECIGIMLSVLVSSGLLTFISFLVTPLMSAAVYFVEVSRNIELYIRGSLLPIAAGVMSDDGWRGAGGRYIKKLLALATQKIVLSLTCVMTSAMTTMYLASELSAAAGTSIISFIGSSFTVIITAIVICIAGLSFLFKSLQVVNDLWGAT